MVCIPTETLLEKSNFFLEALVDNFLDKDEAYVHFPLSKMTNLTSICVGLYFFSFCEVVCASVLYIEGTVSLVSSILLGFYYLSASSCAEHLEL